MAQFYNLLSVHEPFGNFFEDFVADGRCDLVPGPTVRNKRVDGQRWHVLGQVVRIEDIVVWPSLLVLFVPGAWPFNGGVNRMRVAGAVCLHSRLPGSLTNISSRVRHIQ